MSIIPSLDTGGNQLFLPSSSNINDISLISIFWSDILGKPSFCNVAITANYNDLINLPSNTGSSSVVFSGDYNGLSNLPWINNNSNIYFIRNANIGIGTTNPNTKLHLIGNFSIEGNIIPTISSNFDLGSSNFKWKDLFLAGNSIFLDNLILSKNSSNNLEIKDTDGNFKNLNLNSIELNNLNDKVILSLSNQQLVFNSNGTIFNSINFNNYSNIIYSNVLSNVSNQLLNYTNTSINNINIPNTDTIIIGTSNRFITSNTYSNNLTITSNLFINGNYYLKNQLLPFSISSNTSITTSNGLFSYINNCNFGYYTFLTNGSITFPQTTSCDILVVGAGGNGGIGALSGGGGAGEVISYPNYTFNQGTYNIKTGINSFNSNDKISSITSNNFSIIAQGGGNGASLLYSNLSNTLSNINIYTNATILLNNSNTSNIKSGNYNIIFNGDDSVSINNININTNSITLSNNNFNNPTAWYRFDDPSSLGRDYSGNNLNFTNSTNPVLYNTSTVVKGTGSALFNFANARFLRGTGANINNKSFSICVWLYPFSIASGRDTSIYTTNYNGTFGTRLNLVIYYSASAINFAFYADDLNVTITTANDLNRWNYYCFVYDKENGRKQRIYRNGIKIGERTTGGDLNSTNTVYNIGNSYVGDTAYFDGNMDDFRIYAGTALTDAQVLELYENSSFSGFNLSTNFTSNNFNSNYQLRLFAYDINSNKADYRFKLINNATSTNRDILNLTNDGFIGINIKPEQILHLNRTEFNSNVLIRFTNSTTGTTINDGSTIGIDTNQDLIIENKEIGKHLIFDTEAIEKMRILNNGNVGIGLTIPQQKLSVNGVGEFITANGNKLIFSYTNNDYKHRIYTFHDANTDANNYFDFYTWRVGQNVNADGDRHCLRLSTIHTHFPANFNKYFWINNEIIDRSTYNHSTTPLCVFQQTASSSTILNDPQPVLTIARQGTSGQAYGNRATFKLCRYENSSTYSRTRLDLDLANDMYDDVNIARFYSDGTFQTKQITALSTNSLNIWAGTNGNLSFSVGNPASERMRITYAGNIGLNTTVPRALLDIYAGSLLLRASGQSGSTYLYMATPNDTNNDALKCALICEGLNTFSRSKFHISLDKTADNSTTYNASLTNGIQFTLKYNGYGAFGNRNPFEDGTAPASFQFIHLGNSTTANVCDYNLVVHKSNGSGGSRHFAIGYDDQFYETIGDLGYNNIASYWYSHLSMAYAAPDYTLQIFTNGNASLYGTLSQGSDIKIKKDIKTIDNALWKVQQLRGVYYTHIIEGTKNIGLIAQEVEGVIPEVVSYDERSKKKSVAYGNLVSLLINAIKEQQEIIDNQEIRINSIEEILKRNNII